jgi:hypothetical protein
MKILYVLSIGIINILTGKTMYDWSIYDHVADHVSSVSLTRNGSLLLGGGGEIGDEIELRGNDSQRLLGRDKIVDNCKCTKDEVLAMLKKNGYDYYPLRAFKARAKDNRKLKTSYSVK